jgi:cyclin-dependent kinase 7
VVWAHGAPLTPVSGVEDYTFAVDVWSVGCTIAELMLGTILFRTPSPGSQTPPRLLEVMFKICGDPSEATWPGHQELPLWSSLGAPSHRASRLREHMAHFNVDSGVLPLLEDCLILDPAQRKSAADILSRDMRETGYTLVSSDGAQRTARNGERAVSILESVHID